MFARNLTVSLLLVLACGIPHAQELSDSAIAEQLVQKWWAIIDRDSRQAYERCQKLREEGPARQGADAIATPDLVARIASRYQECTYLRYERTITKVSREGSTLNLDANVRTIHPLSASGPSSSRAYALATVEFRYVFHRSDDQWRLADVLRRAPSALDGSPIGPFSPVWVPRTDDYLFPPYLQ